MAVGQEKMGIDNPEVIKAVGLFGGGISGTGDACGAFLGGITLISSLFSRGTPDEEESPEMFRLGQMLEQAFVEITKPYGGKDCWEIVQVDWTDRQQVRDFYDGKNPRRQNCPELVGKTAQALGEILEREVIGKTRG